MIAYYDNYLIDTTSRVILGVEATPALFHQEAVAARKMLERVEKFGLQPESLGGDKGYGSGEFLAWLLERGVQPHIPVIDRRIRLVDGSPATSFSMTLRRMSTTAQKGKRCAITVGNLLIKPKRTAQPKHSAKAVRRKNYARQALIARISGNWYQPARQAVLALVGTPAYERSRRARCKIEALFAELKQRMRLEHVRLRRLWNVGEQFLLAATAQN